MTSKEISKILRGLADVSIAKHSKHFFKTGKGEYGEGDRFLGIRVPVIRKEVKKFKDISHSEIQKLLHSAFHEERLCALLLLVQSFAKGSEKDKNRIYEIYLNNTAYINNWDLVDSSAYQIVGAYLADKDKKPLYDLAEADSLWERRIAIMATFYLIKRDRFDDALAISRRMIHDKEDLIHKAVGWMLREIGKRDIAVEQAFLKKHYKKMPRTMLRYAIEKFPEKERKRYLQGLV